MVGDARFLHFRARIVKTVWPVKVFIPDKGKGLCPLPPEASRFRLSKLTGLFTAVFVLLQAGAVVQPGTLLAEIVPEEKAVTIRANLKPENVADVYVGQIARISLSAYDVSRYGSLEGVVKHIASNTTEREGQPPFYETIITVPDPVFPKIDLTPDIVPGMTAVVDIIGGKRTVLDYILSPLDRAARIAFREN